MRDRPIAARLDARRAISDGLAVFFLALEHAVSFLPGQHAHLGIRDRGKLIEGTYSIVSSPHEGLLEFFIERVDDDRFTARLFRLEPGSALLVKPPQGRFLLDRDSGRPHHVMIATGTGVAPFVSMVRTVSIEEGRNRPPGIRIALLHGASYADRLGYDAELRGIAASRPWLTYVPAVSRPSENPGWDGESGRIESIIEEALDRLGWTPRDTTAYLCGHAGMIEKGEKILADRGFHETQTRAERT